MATTRTKDCARCQLSGVCVCGLYQPVNKSPLKGEWLSLRPLSRMETTMAEVMRLRTPPGPFSSNDDASELWLDIIEDMCNVFKVDSRFDDDAFYEHCFGEPHRLR